MKKILINGIGGPTPRSFAIALRNYSRYDSFEFVGTDCNRYAVGLYQKDLFNKTFLIPKGTAPDYWTAIEEIIRKEEVDYAVFTGIQIHGPNRRDYVYPVEAYIMIEGQRVNTVPHTLRVRASMRGVDTRG